MIGFGQPNVTSKYGAEGLYAMSQGYKYPTMETIEGPTYNKKYKKRQDPTGGFFTAAATALGGLVLFKNRKNIPTLAKSAWQGIKKGYSKLTFPSAATIKQTFKNIGNAIIGAFTKKP